MMMPEAKLPGIATFRFYAELNDLLPPGVNGREYQHQVRGDQTVKAVIEGLGVPHTEVDLILVNGKVAGFDYLVRPGDRVAVYPVFECLDITPMAGLRGKPLRDLRFVLDVHLGKLARWLRMLGFDALYRNDLDDAELADISVLEKRVLLTRDRYLLQRKEVTHGYFVRSEHPDAQVTEVLRRFQLESQIRPLTRCIACNGLIKPVSKEEVLTELEPLTRLYYDTFFRCTECGKIYWRGTHWERLTAKIKAVIGEGEG